MCAYNGSETGHKERRVVYKAQKILGPGPISAHCVYFWNHLRMEVVLVFESENILCEDIHQQVSECHEIFLFDFEMLLLLLPARIRGRHVGVTTTPFWFIFSFLFFQRHGTRDHGDH